MLGTGSLGKEHVRIYSELAVARQVQFVGIYDIATDACRKLAEKHHVRAFSSVTEAAAASDALNIVTPTTTHFELARTLLQQRKHVLVEKPMTDNTAQAAELVQLAQQNHCVLQVGHVERFNPVFKYLESVATEPRFIETHRLSPYPARSTDIGVVLDLMIHDLDIVLSFANSPVKEVRAVGLPILSGKVDIANVRLELESGCIANFTASRVSTERVRKLRFFQPRQYVSLDYGRQEVLVFTVGQDGSIQGAPSVNPQIGVTKPPVAVEEPLHAELKSFLHAVRNRSTSIVPLEDGRRALALALEIVAAIREHGTKVGLAGMN